MAKLFSYKTPKFEELTGSSNYTAWSRNIRNVVADKKGLGHLDRTNDRPISPPGPKTKSQDSERPSIEDKQLEWDENDAAIASLLMQAVSEDIRPELDNIKSAADRWDVLALYKPSGASEYNRLMIKYRNFHHSQYADIPQYCQKFTTLVAELRGINSEPTLKDQNMTFLLNVHPQYREWASRKRSEISTTGKDLAMIKLTTELRCEDELAQSMAVREHHTAAFSAKAVIACTTSTPLH